MATTDLPGYELDIPPWVAGIAVGIITPACGCGVPAAVTLGKFKLFFEKRTATLDRHETEHVFQAMRMRPTWWPWWLGGNVVGVLRFWRAYVTETKARKYWNNKYEVAARRAAGETVIAGG